MKNSVSLLIWFLSFPLLAQSDLVQSGPMTAYSNMREVLLWVQTTRPADVYFTYWDIKNPTEKLKTQTVQTVENNAFIGKVTISKLEPSQKFEYELFINNQKVDLDYTLKFETQPIWKWRGDAPDFSFVTGSCAYINETQYDRPGTPYGSNYQLFTRIYEQNPNFMLWLGDNVYLREVDWDSKTGIQHRFTHAHSLPELQPVWGSMHHYFIWDDHDFGPDNSDRSFPMKKVTNEVFKDFYPNPNYVFDEGTTGFFQWADCEFFLLDNRYWRTPDLRKDLKDPSILGKDQLEWLLDALAYSKASFKFVVMGGQFLNPAKTGESYENCAPEERQYIIDKIKELKINGVLFLSGDVHYSELTKLDLSETYALYDLTVSPFTSGIGGRESALNTLSLPETVVKDHNFAKIEVFGTLKDRALRIHIIDSNGKTRWTKEIKASQLKF